MWVDLKAGKASPKVVRSGEWGAKKVGDLVVKLAVVKVDWSVWEGRRRRRRRRREGGSKKAKRHMISDRGKRYHIISRSII